MNNLGHGIPPSPTPRPQPAYPNAMQQQTQHDPAIISNNNVNDDDSDDDSKPDKRSGRRKIKIEFIKDKSRRHITFSKRKAGIMKKAYELSTLTGTQVLLLVVSETGLVYTFTTPKLQPLVTKPEGKNLIQTCLNAPDQPPAGSDMMASPNDTNQSATTSNAAMSKPTQGNPFGHNPSVPPEAYAQADRKPSQSGQHPVTPGYMTGYHGGYSGDSRNAGYMGHHPATVAGGSSVPYGQQTQGQNPSARYFGSNPPTTTNHSINTPASQYMPQAGNTYWPQYPEGMQAQHPKK